MSFIEVENSDKWNSIVCSFRNYDVFYLNEYVSAFMNEDSKNGIPVLLYYENENDRAINVVFKRDLADDEKFNGKIERGKYFDLISPYGYGGFWGEISDYASLNKVYNQYCIENGYICEFVRFELFGDYTANYDGETETRTHNVVRTLDMTLEDMWMEFKPKVRKNVKKAQRNELEIILDNTGKYLDEFLEIYYSTMERSDAEKDYYFSRKFFEKLNEMTENIMYFHAVYQGKIVSTELVICGAENAYSYLGGTNREYFDVRPNDFLKFEIIKWAKEKGLKKFVLGGGYGADDGIFQYKACIAPNGIVDFCIGRKIFDTEKYNMLTEMRAKDNPNCLNSGFFPKYRA